MRWDSDTQKQGQRTTRRYLSSDLVFARRCVFLRALRSIVLFFNPLFHSVNSNNGGTRIKEGALPFRFFFFAS